MMITFRTFMSALLMIGFLAGCGVVQSDEERIVWAKDQMATGEYRAAMIELKNVLGSGTQNAEARLLLAEVMLGLGDPLSAEKELAKAVESGLPESDVVSMHLKILGAKNDHTGVLAALGTNQPLLSNDDKQYFRGQALLGLGNAEAALTTFDAWLGTDPSSTLATLGKADALAMGGDFAAAREILEPLVAIESDNADAWQSLAAAHFRSGDYKLAVNAFSNAAQKIKPQTNMPMYAAILAGLVESQLAVGDNEAARLNLKKLNEVSAKSPSTLFLAARSARADGDLAAASRHLQTLLNIVPDNVPAQLFLANLQVMQGNNSQAEALLNRLIAVAPGNIEARKLLARIQLQRFEPGGAVEALMPLLEAGARDGDSDLLTILGQARIQEGESEDAIELFSKASSLAPGDITAKLNLAASYLVAGDASSAISVLENVEVAEGDDLRRDSLLMRAFVENGEPVKADAVADSILASDVNRDLQVVLVADHYLRTEREDVARSTLRDAVDASPAMSRSTIALAHLELSAGNLETARKLFQSILEREENNLNAMIGLAGVAQADGADDVAIATLEEAISAHPDSIRPRAILAQVHWQGDRWEQAEALADELVGSASNDALVSELIGNIYADTGRAEDALVHYQEAARLAPDNANVQLGMGRAYIALDRSVEARKAIERALEISPGWAPALTVLVFVEIGQGQVESAARVLEQFQRLHPADPVAYVLEGELHFYRQNPKEAARAFAKAVELGAGRSAVLRAFQAQVSGGLEAPDRVLQQWLTKNTNDDLTRKFLAQYYQSVGKSDEAVLEYENVLQLNPDDASVLNNLAWEYQQRGDLSRAIELAQRAYNIDSESGSVADTLGWIYHDLGDLEKSMDFLSKASRLAPENGEIQYHYAVVLVKAGDTEEAKKILLDIDEQSLQLNSRERVAQMLSKL